MVVSVKEYYVLAKDMLTLHQYTKMERPEIKWLIPDILPRPGLTVLMGPPFSGKSFLSLQLAIELGAGGRPFGHQLKAPVKVMYLQLDTSEMVWRDRLVGLQRSGVDMNVPVYMPHPDVVAPPLLISESGTKTQLDAALSVVQPDVVMIDVLRELHQFDENDSTSQKIVFDHIQTVFGKYSLILLHHSKKVFGDIADMDPIMLCRGSSYIPGRADAIWLLAGGKLKIVSRFDSESLWHTKRQANGFFDVSRADEHTVPSTPAPDPVEKLQHVHRVYRKKQTGQSDKQLYAIHKDELSDLGISEKTWYRLLGEAGLRKMANTPQIAQLADEMPAPPLPTSNIMLTSPPCTLQ